MKFKSLACIAIAAPILAFAGCSTGLTHLTLSANWYRNTNITTGISDTNEQLEYAVTFEKPSGEHAFTLDYDTGTYTVSLRDDVFEEKQCYYLETNFTITGRYTLNGTRGEDFTDVVTSKVWFLDVSNELRPLRSEKYTLTHSPASSQPTSLDKGVLVYEYNYVTAYNADCNEADVTLTYAQPKDYPEEKTKLQLSGGGTYLDNETILFAMRGVSLNVINRFRTVNPVTRKQEQCGMLTSPSVGEKKFSFAIGGGEAAEHTLSTYTFHLSYIGPNAGASQELTYANKVTEGGVNTYRNVLLEMRVPVLSSMGTLVYKLKNANFTTK